MYSITLWGITGLHSFLKPLFSDRKQTGITITDMQHWAAFHLVWEQMLKSEPTQISQNFDEFEYSF